MVESSFIARVSKMGKRHKMINVPKKNPIAIGDMVKVKKIKPLIYISQREKLGKVK